MKASCHLSDGKTTGYWHSNSDYAPRHASNTSGYFVGGLAYYNNGSQSAENQLRPQRPQPNHARLTHDLKLGRHVEVVENAEQT